jgi:hypothetical protein
LADDGFVCTNFCGILPFLVDEPLRSSINVYENLYNKYMLFYLIFDINIHSLAWPCSRCWKFLLGCFSFMAYYRQSKGLKEFNSDGNNGIGIGIICEHCLFYAIAFAIGLLFFMPSMFFWPWLLQQKSLLAVFASLASAFLLYYCPAKLKV